MIIVTQAIIVFNVLVYAYIEGIREALYYHEATKTNDTIKRNLHSLFFSQRLIVVCFCVLLNANYFLIASCVLMFSFFHDGSYYAERNRLNPAIYPKKFFDHSTTSTAFFEFSFTWRLILFIIGILLFITTLIYTT
jgi:hypothetical protein